VCVSLKLPGIGKRGSTFSTPQAASYCATCCCCYPVPSICFGSFPGVLSSTSVSPLLLNTQSQQVSIIASLCTCYRVSPGSASRWLGSMVYSWLWVLGNSSCQALLEELATSKILEAVDNPLTFLLWCGSRSSASRSSLPTGPAPMV
jgi:hypothetical protein